MIWRENVEASAESTMKSKWGMRLAHAIGGG